MKTKITLLAITLALFGLSNGIKAQIVLVEPAGTGSQDITIISSANNNLYFFGREEGGSTSNIYLWSNNGLTSTKILLMSQVSQNISPDYVTPCNGKGFFTYSNGVGANGYELWVTDGTAAGTMMVKDINPGTADSDPGKCFCFNSKVYFSANDGTSGEELWSSDGTSAGTTMVKDINAGSGNSTVAGQYNFVVFNNEMYFLAKSGAVPELWHSDGTAGGTAQLIFPTGLTAVWSTSSLSVFNNMLYFLGTYNSQNNSLMKTDGTTAGTVLVGNNFPSSISTPQMGKYTILGTEALFNYNVSGKNGFYKTDGTTITLVKDSLSFGSGVLLGNNVVFSGTVLNGDKNLWITDGTTSGTSKLSNLPATAGTYVANVVGELLSGKVYFSTAANYVVTGIWESDGTTSGTVQVATGNTMGYFNILNNELFFGAKNSANGNRPELFKLGSGGTGIYNQYSDSRFNFYPNPTTGQLTVEVPDYMNSILEIHNVEGQLLQKTILKSSKTTVQIDNLPSGIYFAKVQSSQCVTTKKIIKY